MDYLGHILWFTIGDPPDGKPIPISRDQLEKWFVEYGLPVNVLPEPVRPVDAFRAASSGVERKYTVDKTDFTLKTIDVSSDKATVIRHIVRTHRARGRLVEAKAAELKFIRPVRSSRGIKPGTEMWQYALNRQVCPPGTEHYTQVADLIETFSARYVNHEKWVPVAALRKIVRDTLTDLAAVLLKPSGGVYFVPQEKSAALVGLQDVVNQLGPSCVFRVLPLVDDQVQRKMVDEAFTDDVGRDAARLIARAENLRPAAEPERIAELERDLLALMTRTEEHMARLPELDQAPVADLLEKTGDTIHDILSNRRTNSGRPGKMTPETRTL